MAPSWRPAFSFTFSSRLICPRSASTLASTSSIGPSFPPPQEASSHITPATRKRTADSHRLSPRLSNARG